MPQVRNWQTGHVLGDKESGAVHWRRGEMSTPFTRGTEYPLDEAWHLIIKNRQLEIIAPDGVWWKF
jgi:hypothetical protein